jgi:hypothetical protein
MRAWTVLILTLVLLGAAVLEAPGASAGATPPGDVNCNNSTDAIDSTLILQYDARLLGALACQSAGDVNGDGIVNSVDSTIILQFVAGLLPALSATLRVDVETPGTINVGEEFVVTVRIENANEVAAFGFRLLYDHNAATYLSTADLGAFFTTSERPAICGDPSDHHDEPLWDCVTLGAPRCLGGPAGASGSGVLARLTFRADRAGTTALALSNTSLVWDDVQPCNPAAEAVPLPHVVQGTNLVIAP